MTPPPQATVRAKITTIRTLDASRNQRCRDILKNARAPVAAALLVLNAEAGANAVYNYVGNHFTSIVTQTATAPSYDTTMNVTGTLVFQNPLAANSSVFDAFSNPTNPLISFEFKDGLHVLTDANTTLGGQSRINVGTDNNGTIKDWYIDLYIGDLGAALLVMDTVEIISSGGNLCGGGCNVDEFGVIYHNALGYPAPNNNSIEVNIGRANGAGIWTLQPVPLPGTLGLLGIGLVGLSNLRRKFMTTNLGTGGIQSESC